MSFSFQEAAHIAESFLAHTPGPSTRITVVYTHDLSEKAQSSREGGCAAALVKELARCVERNKNPWNAVPVGVIHHCGTDGSSEGLPPNPSPVGPHLTLPIQLTGQAQQRPSLAGIRTADGWAQLVLLGRAKPALKRHFRRPVGCHVTCFREMGRVCAV